MTAIPGTADFSAAIDAAKSIGEIEALREALEYSAAEFSRRAGLNETAYSRRTRGTTKPRTKTIRILKNTLRLLAAERASA